MKEVDKKRAEVEQCGMAVVICRNKILAIKESIYGKEISSLPKGHQEKNEEILETAIRECYEETGVALPKESLVRQLTEYSYEFLSPAKRLVRKNVTPFLFWLNEEKKTNATEKNVVSVRWLDIEAFLNQCPFDNVKNVVIEAISYCKPPKASGFKG